MKDDTAALEAVRALLAAHPKWGEWTAALHYARKHPEGIKPESIARRLTKKLKAAEPPPEPELLAPPREVTGSPTAAAVEKLAKRSGTSSGGPGPPIRR